ncbi:MAG TPA: hypothetical protein PK400_04065 [Phycisphaerales bacterium]|nr:hypothetical protein [Phycisphaerales bacterium]HRQ76131.1 hypothetical protein [Phycisphaerales bacterium]
MVLQKVNRFAAACVAMTTVGAVASGALAGFVPGVSITLIVSDGGGVIFSDTVNPGAIPIGPAGFHFPYAIGGGAFEAYGAVNVNPKPNEFLNGYLNTVTHVKNNSGQLLNFQVIITGDLDVASAPALDWTMGSTWSVEGPNPLVWTAGGLPLARGYLNGGQIGSLYDAPSGMGGGTGPLNLNTSPISGNLPNGATSAGLRFAFDLSGNNNVATTNTEIFFTVIPAPAGLAIFGMFGMMGSRRRR